jgi:hypothetical protein
MIVGFTLCAALSLPAGSCPHRGSSQEIQGREAAQTGTGRACRQVAESRIRDWLIRIPSSPAMYATHMVDGRSSMVKGDGSEMESQVRHLGTESTSWFGAGPHQAEHTHRHQTAVFRSGETRPEAGSKRALPSNNSGASPLRPGSL